MNNWNEKEYNFVVTLKFSLSLMNESKNGALENLKHIFKDEYNIEITDDEITIENESEEL